VDVRLLVPGGTDIPVLRPLSRAGYRPLLQAGVRVFEWNGPMLHAKTAVADRKWSRVGSSNLNVASWLGNYELDAIMEDEGFAATMTKQYLEDLTNATEVVLLSGGSRQSEVPRSVGGAGSAGRALAGAVRLGNTVAAAMGDRRVLQPADMRTIGTAGAVLIALAAAAIYWPRLVAIPLALLAAWIGGALLVRTYRLQRRRSSRIVSELPRNPEA
jgi:cardiolipin synthase